MGEGSWYEKMGGYGGEPQKKQVSSEDPVEFADNHNGLPKTKEEWIKKLNEDQEAHETSMSGKSDEEVRRMVMNTPSEGMSRKDLTRRQKEKAEKRIKVLEKLPDVVFPLFNMLPKNDSTTDQDTIDRRKTSHIRTVKSILDSFAKGDLVCDETDSSVTIESKRSNISIPNQGSNVQTMEKVSSALPGFLVERAKAKPESYTINTGKVKANPEIRNVVSDGPVSITIAKKA